MESRDDGIHEKDGKKLVVHYISTKGALTDILIPIAIPNPTIKRERILLKGDIPNPANPPSGCKFHKRFPLTVEKCSRVVPTFRNVRNNHFVACHFV
ncbi:oligopeptide/dipeptide ABC transporter ATP-binding protein [Bacillus chungangensis]|uniref:Oligopeptide/dipeptide ABC transporter ATP-binding protein n=1 Tax=Bacillus chungangensis TaxID=587633 RepID=A0ABT9WXG9_9BACI|nr:oligopeptide/dipeptide ABC transporter ATP-binding protein [Bacillus chungangensis]